MVWVPGEGNGLQTKEQQTPVPPLVQGTGSFSPAAWQGEGFRMHSSR